MQPTSDGAINIRPMGDDLVTTLCLHHGPLAAAQLRHSPDNGVDTRLLHHPWPDSLLDELAPRLGQNLVCPPGASSERREFLREVNHRYGTCAIQAWHDDKIVGVIRFFPSALLLRMGRSSEGLRHSWFWPAVEADDPANTLRASYEQTPDAGLDVADQLDAVLPFWHHSEGARILRIRLGLDELQVDGLSAVDSQLRISE